MKTNRLRIPLITLAIAIAATPVAPCYGQRPAAGKFGEEHAEIAQANAELDRVYKQFMNALERDEQKTALREAERAWIAWRDSEAKLSASLTAVGGSAFTQDFLIAQGTLIRQRTAVLKEHLKLALADGAGPVAPDPPAKPAKDTLESGRLTLVLDDGTTKVGIWTATFNPAGEQKSLVWVMDGDAMTFLINGGKSLTGTTKDGTTAIATFRTPGSGTVKNSDGEVATFTATK